MLTTNNNKHIADKNLVKNMLLVCTLKCLMQYKHIEILKTSHIIILVLIISNASVGCVLNIDAIIVGVGTGVGYVVAGSAAAAGGWAIGAAAGMAAGYSLMKKFLD
jgi:hypothetical protein